MKLTSKTALASGLIAFACTSAATAASRPASRPVAFPPPQNYGYDIPVQPDAPWPEMRRDRFNSGNSPIVAQYYGDKVWTYTTAKGIFSTPIVDRDGTVYVGSADNYFYAVGRDGTLKWKFKTGNIIDSAAVIGDFDPVSNSYPLTFGSGDTFLYHLSGNPALSDDQRVLWKFQAIYFPQYPELFDWWEGNVVRGMDGSYYAGNTGGPAYAFNPDGSLKWYFQTGQPVWTAPTIDEQNNTVWGSLNLTAFSLKADGKKNWQRLMGMYVTSSAARGSDGTLYMGSFDHYLRAMDPATGHTIWKFKTNNLVYASPALSKDASGNTLAIYITSCDGSLYKISPSGQLLWRYDTGDPIRSSPSVGQAPAPQTGDIVYFGSGNGKVYAINGNDGSRRWSYDATPNDAILHDRNDVNASPALGDSGVYLGSESGLILYVPYDYCLHNTDSRCSTAPGPEFAPNLTRVFDLTPGGSTQTDDGTHTVNAAQGFVERLVVTDTEGNSIPDALVTAPLLFDPASKLVKTSPSIASFTARTSGDGQYLFMVPNDFLKPGTNYDLTVSGKIAPSNYKWASGTVTDTVHYTVAKPMASDVPLSVGTDSVTAFQWTRLALPEPVFLPSVNQIGFDFYNWIVGTLDKAPADSSGTGKLLVWVAGAKSNASGQLVVDPTQGFAFPLAGRTQNDAYILSMSDFSLTLSFGPTPVRRFDMRGQFNADLTQAPGAMIYAEVHCPDVPIYGIAMVAIGLCSKGDLTLPISGTFVTAAAGATPAASRPAISVSQLSYTAPTAQAAGQIVATISGAYAASDHQLNIVAVDADTLTPLGINFGLNTKLGTDASGNVTGVTLTLPAGTALPAHLRAYVVSDVFPLLKKDL